MSQQNKSQTVTTPKVEMNFGKPETPKQEEKREQSFDELVDEFVNNSLSKFHGLLSAKGMDGKEPQLDLATDKIAQAMTALQNRSKTRRKEKTYGKG